MKVGGLLLLKTLAEAQSSVITDTYPVDLTKVDENVESVNYIANTNFKVCSCDMTTESCDPFCCCDTSCPASVTDEWKSNNRCADINYQTITGKVFSPCLSRADEFKFNKQNGLNNYIDPLSKLLCVTIDNSPDFATCYVQTT